MTSPEMSTARPPRPGSAAFADLAGNADMPDPSLAPFAVALRGVRCGAYRVTRLGWHFWWPVLAMLATTALYVALLQLLVGDARQLANQVFLTLSYLTAGSICAWVGLRTADERLRRAWLWWAVGWLSFSLGQIIYGYLIFVQHNPNPFPTLGDFFFLLAYPFLVLGISAFPMDSTSGIQRVKLWLDASVGACAILDLSWFFLLGPMFFAGSSSAFDLAVSLGYPLGDIAVLVALYRLALHGIAKPYRSMYLLLALGMLCYVAADSGYAFGTLQGTYTAATLSVDGFWLLGAFVMALAPLYHGTRSHRSAHNALLALQVDPEPTAQVDQYTTLASSAPTTQSRMEHGVFASLVYVPVLIVFLLVGADQLFPIDDRLTSILDLLALVVVMLVITRQLLTINENRRLVHEQQAALQGEAQARAQLEAANTELHTLSVQATESARSKSEFLANMSHEIRTPMNGVIGMAELVLETPLTDEQRDYMTTLHGSAYALLALLNDILDFSKIEAGKLEVEQIACDVREVVEGVADILSPKAREKGLALMTFVAPEVPAQMLGDPSRLRQILLNLVGNAVKFTEMGQVIVRVNATPLIGEAEQTQGPTMMLRFAVEDSGIGLSPAARERLFQPFTQADGSTTRKYGGTGLGLSISRRLIELMGGEIRVESVEGEGSTFWFTLACPREDPTAPGYKEPTSSLVQEAILVGKRILVVDDNPAQRQILQTYLTAFGMLVACLPDATRALAVLEQAARLGQPIDVAVLDLMLPGIDGFALAQAIRLHPGLASTQLVLLTAFDEAGLGQRARQLGFAAYLTKPLKLRLLRETLLRIVGKDTERDLFTRASDVSGGWTPDASRESEHSLEGTGMGIQTAPSGTSISAPVKPRILLAEDNAVNRKLAVLQLKRLGYTVDTAIDGHEVLAQIAQASQEGQPPFGCVLMDCQMPELDGFEATRRIRALEAAQTQAGPDDAHTRLPIIAMTANALEGDRERCEAAGMDDYLSKPVTLEALRTVLARWVVTSPVSPTVATLSQAVPGTRRTELPSTANDAMAPHSPTEMNRGRDDTRMDSEHLAPNLQAEVAGNVLRSGQNVLADSAETVLQAVSGPTDLQDTDTVPPPISIEKPRVLVVEDYPLNQRLTRLQLERLGLESDVVANGREALKALSGGTYALVLMDCQMPVMDGYEATRAIRLEEATSGTQHMPIVAVTANALEGDRERCLLAGMDDYLAKPVQLGQLEQVVRYWLHTSNPEAEYPDTGSWESLPPPADTPVERPQLQSGPQIGSEPIVDEMTLHALQALQGAAQQDVVARILAEFRVDAPLHLTHLHAALTAENLRLLQQSAHLLKTGAVYVGARRVGQVCAMLEALCRVEMEAPRSAPAVDRQLLGQLIAEAETAFAAFQSALEQCPSIPPHGSGCVSSPPPEDLSVREVAAPLA